MKTAFSHMSVLVDEVLASMAPHPGGVYVDATLGGGGHAERILDASSPDGRLVGIDRDADALDAARARLERFGDRVLYVHGRMGDVRGHLTALGISQVSGILIDLGVSSPQLDRADRGFSFRAEGPLDMRMDRTSAMTAARLLEELTVEELERVLSELGEERYSRRIARAIKEAVGAGEVKTTTDLAKLVARATPPHAARQERIDPATRTFQALRIAVNDELGELARFLADFPDLLEPGGRCVVISFHSLEDRPVKDRFRELEWTSRLPDDLAAAVGERTVPICRSLTRKPVTAGEAELTQNPRARSAKLRACEKVAS